MSGLTQRALRGTRSYAPEKRLKAEATRRWSHDTEEQIAACLNCPEPQCLEGRCTRVSWAGRVRRTKDRETRVYPAHRKGVKLYDLDGEKYTAAELAQKAHVSMKTMWKRLREGQTPEEAVRIRAREKKDCGAGGKVRSVRELAERLGVSEATIRGRLHAGWTVERILQTPKRAYMKRTDPELEGRH